MEAGPAVMAVIVAVLTAVWIVTTVAAARQSPPAAPRAETAAPPRPRPAARPRPRPAAEAPAAEPVDPAQVTVRCRQLASPEPQLLVSVTNHGPSPLPIAHAALLFWPGDDGRWSWQNLFTAIPAAAAESARLPAVLEADEELRLALPKDALLDYVRANMPAGGDGFGVRLFPTRGEPIDSPVIRQSHLDADCPLLEPLPPVD